MIRLEQVTRYYGSTMVVAGLSFEVPAGEVCVLIGPSGCGKTTTLRMINRLVEPSSGRIYVNGQDVSRFKPERLRQSIGYAIQGVGLFPHMTVAQNIAVVPQLLHWTKEHTAARIEEMLALVGLEAVQYGAKYPHQLSGGEAQRVGVARALAADPPILLMDEPFGAVDPLTREKLQAEFARIQQVLKKTVIFVTHDLDEAVRLADRIAIMQSGRLVQYDTPENILTRPANKFVHDFVGTDRALKRLSRINVQSLLQPAPSLEIDTTSAEIATGQENYHWFWVVDGTGRLLGWVDRADLVRGATVRQAATLAEAGEIAVTGQATLREALSRMLGQGFKYLPVIDDKKRLIGEIKLRDIEAATAEVDNNAF